MSGLIKTREFNQLVGFEIKRDKLTKGQYAVLKLITDCVNENKSMDFDMVVKAYCESMRSNYFSERYIGEGKYQDVEYDIWTEYTNRSFIYSYSLRGIIKGWLEKNIGNLAVKNKLIVIPIIKE